LAGRVVEKKGELGKLSFFITNSFSIIAPKRFKSLRYQTDLIF